MILLFFVWLFGFLLLTAFRVAIFMLAVVVAVFGFLLAGIFDRFARSRTVVVRDDTSRCHDCGQPLGKSHLGTCRYSWMRSGVTRVVTPDASEDPTVELWPGERR